MTHVNLMNDADWMNHIREQPKHEHTAIEGGYRCRSNGPGPDSNQIEKSLPFPSVGDPGRVLDEPAKK